MLRQLARLTRPLPAAGKEALAVAVYGDGGGAHIVAKESGFEGVACVDDAARLLDVLCDVWARTSQPWAERWARGLLEFVLWMQEPDGRWINFVYDWDGARNLHGITSATGESFWHARALVGVSHAWLTFADERARDALVGPAVEAGLTATSTSPSDGVSCIYSLDRLHEATGEQRWAPLASDARAWFDGRNAAASPVYDRRRGRVADGIDQGRVSNNSGAESNIVAAEALLDHPLDVARYSDDPFGRPSVDLLGPG